MKIILILLFAILFIVPSAMANPAYELYDRDPKADAANNCSMPCNCSCKGPIEANHKKIRAHITDEFIKHREWMVDVFFVEHILPAMALMTSQIEAVSVNHTFAIGGFFDAKHQLETQTMMQSMMADTHKDYQPSDGVCTVGTNVRSLAHSGRKTALVHAALSDQIMKRQTRNNEVLSAIDENSDNHSRLDVFANKHCSLQDNGNGLNRLCKGSAGPITQRNKDVNFIDVIDQSNTLNLDLYKDGADDLADDEADVFAMMHNLYNSDPMPIIARRMLADKNGVPKTNAYEYLDMRAAMAKRSVAQNSIAALTAEKAKGDPEVATFLRKIVVDLGVKDNEIDDILGEGPSYYAQMDVLTKLIYQDPQFYTDLYDNPANVQRKNVMIRAINLMQERDFYKSQLRQESVLAVLLETMLHDEQRRVHSILAPLSPEDDE